jgi:O-antigen/teichoic acid export membrane protein
MKVNRTKNALKIVSASMVEQVVIVVCGLILPRLLIQEYGSEVNGLVSSIKQFLTYFSVVSSGISVASNAALYQPLARNDHKKINGILSATAVFFRKSAYLFIALLSVLALVYPFAVRSSVPKTDIFLLILILSAGMIMEYMFLGKYRTLITADQKLYVEANLQSQGFILNLAVSVVLIYLHFSILVVQLVATLVYILRAFRLIRYVKTNYSYVDFKVEPDMDSISNRWAAFSYQVSSIVISYTPVVLLTFMAGLKDVSVYSVYNMVFSAILMIVNVFSSGLSASFGNLIARNEKRALLKSYNTYEYIYFTITFLCYACALKLILPFISIYTKNINDANYIVPQLALWFVISGLVRMLRTPSVTLVEAAGKYAENKNLNLVEAALNIVLSVVFTLVFGISGVLIGVAVASLLRSVLYILYVQRHLLQRNLTAVFLRILVNALMIAAVYFIPFHLGADSILSFFILSMAVFLASALLFFFVNSAMDRESFLDVLERIKELRENRLKK